MTISPSEVACRYCGETGTYGRCIVHTEVCPIRSGSWVAYLKRGKP